MNYTSIEQSKKLLELGLNPETADMYHTTHYMIKKHKWDYDNDVLPSLYGKNREVVDNCILTLSCWSLDALFNVIKKAGWDYKINYCSAILSIAMEVKCRDTTNVEKDANLFEVVYKSVIWMLEHDYIKK